MTTPPHSQEAEESIIGACLMDPEAYDRVDSDIGPEDFYFERYAEVFRSMAAVKAVGMPIDLPPIVDELKRRGTLQVCGGLATLIELTENTVTSATVEYSARIVKDKSALRNLIKTATGIAEEAYTSPTDVADFLDSAGQRFQQAVAVNCGEDPQDMSVVVMETIDAIAEAKKGGGSGVSTGLSDLDRLFRLRDTSLIILAGDTSMGKTALALDLTMNVEAQGKRVAFFSLEMSKEELTMRMLSKDTGITYTKIEQGQLTSEEERQIALSAGRLATKQIIIDDPSMMSIGQLRSKARKLAQKKNGGIGMIVVDYLQLMQGDPRAGNREQEIASISRGLKSLAKELHVPVIALSQLNRELGKRQDKRPTKTDLRESGAIEQDANIIAFVYRDEYYNPDTNYPGETEVIVGKNRNGPTGTAYVRFNAKTMSYESKNGIDPIEI
jgi:replicative DNA helicase